MFLLPYQKKKNSVGHSNVISMLFGIKENIIKLWFGFNLKKVRIHLLGQLDSHSDIFGEFYNKIIWGEAKYTVLKG